MRMRVLALMLLTVATTTTLKAQAFRVGNSGQAEQQIMANSVANQVIYALRAADVEAEAKAKREKAEAERVRQTQIKYQNDSKEEAYLRQHLQTGFDGFSQMSSADKEDLFFKAFYAQGMSRTEAREKSKHWYTLIHGN